MVGKCPGTSDPSSAPPTARVPTVILVNTRTPLVQPLVIRASQGACFVLPVLTTDAVNTAGWLKDHQFTVMLADPNRGETLQHTCHADRCVLIIGSERHGLSGMWASLHGIHVRIPMHGVCDSLNAGVAASILLYESME